VNKALALVFVFIVLSSLMVLTVKPVDAQAEAKPMVPEFTLKLVDKPWIISPIQTIDPYTGTSITKPGYQVEHKVVEITVKNQNCPNVMYSVRVKGHFEQEWRITHGHNGAVAWFTYQSDGKSTVIELATMRNQYEKIYPDGAQIDIQVMALQGEYVRKPAPGNEWYIGEFFEGVTSDWSKTQTITVTYGSSLSPPSQTATSNNNQPQASTYYSSTQEIVTFVPYSGIIILLCVIVITIGIIVSLAVVLLLRRHPKTTNTQPQQS